MSFGSGNITNNKGQETLDDENPLPAVEISHALHLHDTKGQETTKGTRGGGGGEEDGHAQTALMAPVPQRDASHRVSRKYQRQKE
jgi:hypothetical protein